MSFLGPNITDSRLFKNKSDNSDDSTLYMLRPDNWAEKIGKVSSDKISLLRNVDGEQRLVTLKDFLENIGKAGSYVGMDENTNLYNEDTDGEVGVRFQVTFLPDGQDFLSEMYSYETKDDEDPQNLVLFCTSECTSVQYPGSSSTVLHQHVLHEDGLYHSHTLTANKTSYGVGGSQEESPEEVKLNNERGEANAVRIGLPQMGKDSTLS